MVSRKPRQGTGKRSSSGRKAPSRTRARAPNRATQRKPALATAAAGRKGMSRDEEE